MNPLSSYIEPSTASKSSPTMLWHGSLVWCASTCKYLCKPRKVAASAHATRLTILCRTVESSTYTQEPKWPELIDWTWWYRHQGDGVNLPIKTVCQTIVSFELVANRRLCVVLAAVMHDATLIMRKKDSVEGLNMQYCTNCTKFGTHSTVERIPKRQTCGKMLTFYAQRRTNIKQFLGGKHS